MPAQARKLKEPCADNVSEGSKSKGSANGRNGAKTDIGGNLTPCLGLSAVNLH